MADVPGLQEAAEALKAQFGERLDAGHDDGRDQMVDALCGRFGISKQEAKELVSDLEKARSIRWVEGGGLSGAAPIPTLSAGGVIAGSSQTSGGAYAYGNTASGYWQL